MQTPVQIGCITKRIEELIEPDIDLKDINGNFEDEIEESEDFDAAWVEH